MLAILRHLDPAGPRGSQSSRSEQGRYSPVHRQRGSGEALPVKDELDSSPAYTLPGAALFEVALEAIGEAVLVTTPDLDAPGPIIVYANPAFYRMTGYVREEVIGRSPRFLQGPETDRTLLNRVRETL